MNKLYKWLSERLLARSWKLFYRHSRGFSSEFCTNRTRSERGMKEKE
jgi:hypothetical protein